jgi:hypothetical protein
MTTIRTALMAGAAALALFGIAGAASAESPPTHVLTIQLPGGGTEQIRYAGDVPPQIVLQPDVGSLPVALGPPAGFWDTPFAGFDRIAAEMDRNAATLLRQAEAMTNASLLDADKLGGGAWPAGGEGYSFIASLSGDGVCTRSVTITSGGDGAQPRVVSHTSGTCGPAPRAIEPAGQPAAPARRPDTINVKAERAPSPAPLYAGLVHPIPAWPQ